MERIRFLSQLILSLAIPTVLWACTQTNPPIPPTAPAPETTSVDTEAQGELEIRANGEDFVRQGLVTKDGWKIQFDQVYVTLAEVTAYQSDPPFDAEAGGVPEAKTIVSLNDPVTIDLAAGDETADPILVGTLTAPAGRYNALSWQMLPATADPAKGQTLWLQGTATQADRTINFTIKLDPTLGFVCGDYVGDDRKGFLAAGGTADLEATFHFDHLFGDGNASPEDEINTGALGFDPLATIAQESVLDVDQTDLEAQLSATDYDRLLSILPSLGHVGEGHCEETELTRS